MITAAKLKTKTVKDLAAMAKKKKVSGWHSMRKDELVRALVRHARTAAAKRVKSTGKNARSRSDSKAAIEANGSKSAAENVRSTAKQTTPGGKKKRTTYAQRRLKQIKARLAAAKDLTFKSVSEGNGLDSDRLVVMVRDPFWLHAYWELTRASINRAKAALGQYWHAARPVLRVNQVTRNGTTSTARKVVRDVEIHGGVSNWYLDVQDPPKSYQIEIGYLGGEKFHSIARSNIVTTPRANSCDSFDQNWTEVAKESDRIYALSGGYSEQDADGELRRVFEEQLRRPMGDPMSTRFGAGAARKSANTKGFNFSVDTELIVHGVADPNAHVTLRGEPVHVREDGSFAVRFSLPNRRHVLPVVASSRDGAEQQTIVLAVDRNTKVMEPVIRDPVT